MSQLLPPCLGEIQHAWPWREPLPGAQWATLRFDTRHLAEDDFARCGIDAPEAIHRAAAKRRVEFLAGRVCARQALYRLTGRLVVPGVAESKAPIWPPGLVGSITHSGDLAAALVAPRRDYRGVGMDAERPLSHHRAERLAGQILTPGEREWLATLPGDRLGEFVTLAFSAKESLFKALFPIVGVRFYFQDAELIAWDRERQQVTLQLLKSLAPGWPTGQQLHGQYAHHDAWLLSVVSIPT